MATAAESVQFSNISATTAAFTLRGGAAYALTVHATFGGGNLQLQILAIDNTTWLNVGSTVTADGITTYSNLPPDQYRIVVTTATGVFAALTRIPV